MWGSILWKESGFSCLHTDWKDRGVARLKLSMKMKFLLLIQPTHYAQEWPGPMVKRTPSMNLHLSLTMIFLLSCRMFLILLHLLLLIRLMMICSSLNQPEEPVGWCVFIPDQTWQYLEWVCKKLKQSLKSKSWTKKKANFLLYIYTHIFKMSKFRIHISSCFYLCLFWI